MVEEPHPRKQISDEDEDVVQYEDVGVHMPNKVEEPKQSFKVKDVDMRTTEQKIIDEMSKT